MWRQRAAFAARLKVRSAWRASGGTASTEPARSVNVTASCFMRRRYYGGRAPNKARAGAAVAGNVCGRCGGGNRRSPAGRWGQAAPGNSVVPERVSPAAVAVDRLEQVTDLDGLLQDLGLQL